MVISVAGVLSFMRTAKRGCRLRIQGKMQGRKQTFRSQPQRGVAERRRPDRLSRGVQGGRSQELISELQRNLWAL